MGNKRNVYLPSGLVNSLRVGKEKKVWATETVGSKTQAISLGLQDFIQRMVSDRSSLGALQKRINHIFQTKITNTKGLQFLGAFYF